MSINQRARETNKHRTTISRILEAFLKDGFSSLERKKRTDKGTFAVSDELTEMIRAHRIALPNLPCSSIQRMIARICTKKSWAEPTYWNIYRIHNSIPADLLTLSRDSAEYRRHYEMIHRFEASCPNEIWQADHNFMDIFVWDDHGQALKPVLTIILDDYSRAVTGYYLDFVPPSAQRTALALRQAIWHKAEPKWLACGIPDKLYTDRGSDFTSLRLKQIAIELEFELIKGRPYYPQGKGKIERFFLTMNELFLCDLTGYTAEGEAPQQPGMTLDEFRRTFHDWLINEYMQRENEDTGESPFFRWCNQPQVPRMPETLDKLHMLLMTISETRLVRRDGIHVLNYSYIDTELQNGYMRESVLVRYDPMDVSKIFVFHENKFVCSAVCPELVEKKPTYQDIAKAKNSRKKSLRLKITGAKDLVKSYAADSARPIPPAPVEETIVSALPERPRQVIRRYAVDA
jgi:putative transposase